MSEWVAYTGSDEQIAEINTSKHGYILKNTRNQQSEISKTLETNALRRGSSDRRVLLTCSEVTHYWIIPDDPLREMKIRQAQTGQPVWIRQSYYDPVEEHCGAKVFVTTTPDWNIPNAEYSFTPFED